MNENDHITLGASDTERSARFYDSALAVLGFNRVPQSEHRPPKYEKAGMVSIHIYPRDQSIPTAWKYSNYIALVADSVRVVHAFHDVALRNGGRCLEKPGPRPQLGNRYYAVDVFDLDGNKIQVICLNGIS